MNYIFVARNITQASDLFTTVTVGTATCIYSGPSAEFLVYLVIGSNDAEIARLQSDSSIIISSALN